MRFSHRHSGNRTPHRPALFRGGAAAVAAIAAILTLGIAAPPGLASTGSVFYDSGHNVAAGAGPFFSALQMGWVNNVGVGYPVMPALTAGGGNTAIGSGALRSNSTGSGNVGVGQVAGANLTTGSDNVDIANQGVAGESGTIRIGTAGRQTTAYLAGVYGSTVSGQPVVIDSSGKLGTQPVTTMLNSSSVIDQLRARLDNVRAALQTKADEIRAKVRAKVKNLRQRVRQRDQQLADQIQQIRDRLQGGG